MRDLAELRVEIDQIDRQLVELFNKRMDIAAQVAEYKKANNLPVLDEKREAALLEKVQKLSDESFCEYTLKLYQEILALSKDYQTKILQMREKNA